MTQPWYPFYWSDYSGKTMHLTMGQHGAYMLLLRYVYTTEERIPHKKRFSIARALLEQEQSDVTDVLEEFFVRDGEFWHQPRAERVISDANNAHQKRVNAGKIGGKAKAIAAKNNPSNARVMLGQSQSNALATTTTTTTKDIKSTLTDRSQEKESLVGARKATHRKQTRGEHFSVWLEKQQRIDPDISVNACPDDLYEVAEKMGKTSFAVSEWSKFHDYWIAKAGINATKADWIATWRNWLRNMK